MISRIGIARSRVELRRGAASLAGADARASPPTSHAGSGPHLEERLADLPEARDLHGLEQLVEEVLAPRAPLLQSLERRLGSSAQRAWNGQRVELRRFSSSLDRIRLSRELGALGFSVRNVFTPMISSSPECFSCS